MVLGLDKYKVESATRIAFAFGISPFVIGASMVAVSRSLPELATSLIAALPGAGAISVGNIVSAATPSMSPS